MIPDRKTVEMLRNQYPKGTRLICLEMLDRQAISEGTVGSVDCVDDAGQIHMHWDNGRTLALVPGVDDFRPVITRVFTMPLQVSFCRDQYGDYEELTSADARDYLPDIIQAIEKDFAKDTGYMSARGLAEYLDPDPLDRKVYSIKVTADTRDGKPVAKITCELLEALSDRELYELQDYITGQFSDGWGEGLAQEEFRVNDGFIQIELWDPHKDNSFTEITN